MGKYGIELLDAADAPALDEAGPTEGRAARRDKLVFRFAVVIAALSFRSDGPGHDLHGRLASIIGILVISRRRGGTPLVVCSLLGCLLLARTMGPEVLGDSWNLTLTVFPFARGTDDLPGTSRS